MTKNQADGIPLGYLSLTDELYQQIEIADTPNVQYARAGQVGAELWNFGLDEPSNRANYYPSGDTTLDHWAIFNGETGAHVWNIPAFDVSAFQDYPINPAALATLNFQAPLPQFIDEVS